MTDYETVGGSEAVREVIDDFYDRVLVDEVLAPYFRGSDMPRVRRHQFLVISEAMGGPIAEGVMDITEAHKGRGITEDALSRVAIHLVVAMNDAHWPEEIVQRTAQAVMSYRHQVVEK
jgi:hemoglobin